MIAVLLLFALLSAISTVGVGLLLPRVWRRRTFRVMRYLFWFLVGSGTDTFLVGVFCILGVTGYRSSGELSIGFILLSLSTAFRGVTGLILVLYLLGLLNGHPERGITEHLEETNGTTPKAA